MQESTPIVEAVAWEIQDNALDKTYIVDNPNTVAHLSVESDVIVKPLVYGDTQHIRYVAGWLATGQSGTCEFFLGPQRPDAKTIHGYDSIKTLVPLYGPLVPLAQAKESK